MSSARNRRVDVGDTTRLRPDSALAMITNPFWPARAFGVRRPPRTVWRRLRPSRRWERVCVHHSLVAEAPDWEFGTTSVVALHPQDFLPGVHKSGPLVRVC